MVLDRATRNQPALPGWETDAERHFRSHGYVERRTTGDFVVLQRVGVPQPMPANCD